MTNDNPYTYALTADPDKPLREAKQEIQRLNEQVTILTAERDEARRFVCNREWLMTGRVSTPEAIADERGWDCFKQEVAA